MTTDLASIAVSYAGTDVQDPDGIFLQIVAGIDDSPEVRGQDVVIPYAEGRVIRPRRFDRRRILLEGFVRGVGATDDLARIDYRGNRRTLAALFDTTRVPATLRLVLEDGDVTRVTARPLSIEAVEQVQSLYATVSVELEAVSDWEGLGS